MRRLLGLLALVLLPLPALADSQATATSLMRFDVDSTTVTYCRVVGLNGDPYGGNMTSVGRVTTTASSTTVTSVGSAGTFGPMDVGDILVVDRGAPGAPIVDTAVIVAKASANSITVDAAVNWDASGNGYLASWRDTQCGTTATDGWISVSSANRVTMSIEYNQGDLDNLSVRWECRSSGQLAQPVQVYPNEGDGCGTGGLLASNFCDFATAGLTSRLTVVSFDPWSQCRTGFKVKTTDTSDAGAAIEQVNAYIVSSKP